MSYILNALRKSEQERQSVEPDTVTSRILSHQPQHPRGSGKLIAALIITNLLIVAYFIWFTQKTPPAVKVETTTLAPSEQIPPTQPVAKADALDSSAVRPDKTLPAAMATPAKSPSIADIVAAQKAPEPKPSVKPALAQKPVVARVKQVIPVEQSVMPEDELLLEDEPHEDEPVEIASNYPEALPVKNNDIPFLYELPAEFRRNVPPLAINVFVYAKEPAERFVMIDMVKYKSGQLIKDALELKEIRPDSLVVRYNGQTFQIKRP